LRRRTLAKPRNRSPRQHLYPCGAYARDGNFQVRAGDLNSGARAEGDQVPEL
jgi:hypothetical protein